MDTFDEIIEGIQDDLTLGDDSSFMGLALVKRYANRAYRNKVAALFRWPQLQDAKLTSAIADQEYYDYPQNWRPQSIWKLVVDGTDYEDPLAFRDYQYEKDNDYPSGWTKIWTNKGNRYFIAPTPTADGDNNIEVHGQLVPEKMVDDDDTTIFSYSMPELNEAIVLEAKAMLKSKGEEDQTGQFASVEAKAICANSFNKLKQEQAKYEKTLPMLNVPNFFGKNTSQYTIGNFNRRR